MTKQLNFDWEMKEGLKIEISALCSEDRNVSLLNTEPENGERYSVKLKSVFYNGQNILPVLEFLKADQLIWDKCFEQCFSLFNEI